MMGGIQSSFEKAQKDAGASIAGKSGGEQPAQENPKGQKLAARDQGAAQPGGPGKNSAEPKQTASPSPSQQPSSRSASSTSAQRAPNPSQGLTSWGAYHAARIAAHGATKAGTAGANAAGVGIGAVRSGIAAVKSAAANPGEAGRKIGAAAGQFAGNAANTKDRTLDAVENAAHAVAFPQESLPKAGKAVADGVKKNLNEGVQKVSDAAGKVGQGTSGIREGFREAYKQTTTPPEPPEEKTP